MVNDPVGLWCVYSVANQIIRVAEDHLCELIETHRCLIERKATCLVQGFAHQA